jgi:hypothetical protein
MPILNVIGNLINSVVILKFFPLRNNKYLIIEVFTFFFYILVTLLQNEHILLSASGHNYCLEKSFPVVCTINNPYSMSSLS